MSRFPDVSRAGASVPGSVFAKLREALARFPGDPIGLQLGDTHLPPAVHLDELATDLADYRYGAPNGVAALVDAIVDKVREHNRIPATAGGVQLAVGATHALSCAVQALCDPGDELLLVTPHWSLIRGIALAHNVVPVEADLSDLDAAVTPRTAAIYFATPNNPDGAMMSPAQLAALADFAVRHDLWILADEVYEHCNYDAPHVSIASLGVDERTVTVFSFAKSYAQAGLRVGYAVAPESVGATLKKVVNHTIYNVPVAMQRAALQALETGAAFLEHAHATYRSARDRARARLSVPTACPPGGAYLWLDLRPWSGDDCIPLLEQFAARGVLLAPGVAFGARCGGFARLCFTCVEEVRLLEGIDRLNEVLAGRARLSSPHLR